MTPLFALIYKDIVLFFNDKRALAITLLMPILLAAFFGYLTGGSGKREPAKIDIGLVQSDKHMISQKIFESLKADTNLNVHVLNDAEAQEQVRRGKLAVAVVLPSGFGEAAGLAFFNASKKPELPIYFDPSQNTVLAMLKGILTQHVMQSVSTEMFANGSATNMVDQALEHLDSNPQEQVGNRELKSFLTSLKTFQQYQQNIENQTKASPNKTGQNAFGLGVPFQAKEQALSAQNALANGYNGYAHSFAGMTVQFILFLAIDAGISVLMLRKQGLWGRLLAAPISMTTLLLARALSCAAIAMMVSCVICVVAMIVFQVEILGSLTGLLGIAICFSLMTASFGLLIAAFGKTPEAARGIAIFATLILVMLGGAWMPSFVFPQWLQDITIFIPTRWAVDGFDAMTWRGLGIEAAISPMLALLGFSVLFGCIALWRFNREANLN